MAKCALDAHRTNTAITICESFDADHGIQFKQCNRRRRIIEIYFSRSDLLLQGSWKGIGINLEPTANAVFGETPGPTPPFFSPAMAL